MACCTAQCLILSSNPMRMLCPHAVCAHGPPAPLLRWEPAAVRAQHIWGAAPPHRPPGPPEQPGVPARAAAHACAQPPGHHWSWPIREPSPSSHELEVCRSALCCAKSCHSHIHAVPISHYSYIDMSQSLVTAALSMPRVTTLMRSSQQAVQQKKSIGPKLESA